MISQVIIGCRTWAITRRSKGLGVFLLVFGSIVTVLEWYAGVDLGGRIPVQEDVSFLHSMQVKLNPDKHYFLLRESGAFTVCTLWCGQLSLGQLLTWEQKDGHAFMGLLPRIRGFRCRYMHPFDIIFGYIS